MTILPSLTLTHDLGASIADAVSRGVPLETAARAAGLGRSTVTQWLQAAELGYWPQNGNPITEASKRTLVAFADQIDRARAVWESKQVENVTEAATIPNARTGQVDWRASAWLLNNHPATRQTYREHRESHQTIDVQHHPAHTAVRELDSDTLLMLAEPSQDTSENV